MGEHTKRPYRRATETRALVVDVATRLFYGHGIHAVGIDRIAAEAKVTTATLYRLFGSKEGLVVAYLEEADKRWFAWFERAVGNGPHPLVRLFEELDREVRQPDYRGCPFRMALAEYPTASSKVHQVAVGNKRRTRERFHTLARATGTTEPELMADHLMVLVDGVCASATERSADSPPGLAPAIVRHLVETGLSGMSSAKA